MKNFISKHTTQAAYTAAESSFDKPHVAYVEELAATGGMYYIEDAIDLVAAYADVTGLATDANEYDILWSDIQVTSFVRPTSDNVVPIGICLYPSNNTVTEDGNARFMGLTYSTNVGAPSTTVNKGAPFNNNITTTSVAYGPLGTSVPNIHSGDSYKYTDYDGIGNTAAIVATGNLASYTAAKACKLYVTDGTNVGDWYLGSSQEVQRITAGRNSINEILSNLSAIYENCCMPSLSLSGLDIWTSTEIDTDNAFCVTINDVEKKGKNTGGAVIPMLSVPKGVLDLSRIYSDSNKTTEISTPDADVIYKVSDGTNITYMKWNGSAYEAATFDTKKKYIDGNTKYRWNGTALVAI